MKCQSKSIVVKRVENNQDVSTSEIEKLSESAGYIVEETIVQSRAEDRKYNIGSGKVEQVQQKILENENVKTVIFDNELNPYQKYNLGVYFPEEVTVLDRYSLILDIFDSRTKTKHGQLQVQLARLRYELPRAEIKSQLANRNEKPGFMGLGEYDENEEDDIKEQIARIKDKLEHIEHQKNQARTNRRSDGFDLVAIAGYTNAGKSTLFRRLCEDIEIDENESLHSDLTDVAASASDMFTTLDTKTRRMEHDTRDILLTDTVGFLSNIPNWLVDSFRTTLDSIYEADLVLLSVDSTDPIEIVHEKKVTAEQNIRSRKNKETKIQTVFTKIDEVGPKKIENLRELDKNAIFVSAERSENIDKLKDSLYNRLPPLNECELELEMTSNTMSLISWIYDNAFVTSKSYKNNGIVHISFEGKPAVVEKAKHKANNISPVIAEADD